MTKNTRKCHDCKIRPIDRDTAGRDSTLCAPCYEYAGWENAHSDDAHDVYATPDGIASARADFGDVHVDVRLDEMINCPVCNPELDPRKISDLEVIYVPESRPAQRGNRNAAGKQSSHKMCGHPLTKAAREQCRKNRRENASALDEIIDRQSADTFGEINTPLPRTITDECPKCHASGDEKCKTRTGGRYKGKGGRHPERDA